VNLIVTRAARKSDARTIAELYQLSSDGVSDYIWTTLANPGEDLLDVGQRRYERDDSVFSYRSTSIVEHNGRIAGMLVAFPMSIDENHVETDPVLAPYSQLEEPDSFYICAMAVFEKYRGQGIGGKLLKLAENKAIEQGLKKLSLIVFEENVGAKRLYDRSGFVVVARNAVVPHPLIHHTGDALLMVRALK
jgi:ribosomal protein S18 acetylase RimI-like enzyme